jgi:anti-sigma B factor antagonist
MSSTPPGFSIEADEPEGDRVSIRVKGELDMAATPTLTQTITGLAGVGRIQLDLSGVTFLDSSAIGALVASGRELGENGTRLEIGPRSDIVTRVLEITGLGESSEAFDVLPGDG